MEPKTFTDPQPDHTAIRVALWRAQHQLVDAQPHVIEDDLGLKLAAPEKDWQLRPDMNAQFLRSFRASIVARARFIEDHITEKAAQGINQYVILGAGLDTFAYRRADIAFKLRVFEVDQPEPQAWKHKRLIETGIGIPAWLQLVPVDFESGASWWDELVAAGFDKNKPAVVASTGVSMYLTKEAIAATLRQIAALAPGSTLTLSYLLPAELADPEERPILAIAEAGARRAGTPFLSFFRPEEILALAHECGFKEAHCVPASDQAQRYFANRTDNLRPGKSEELLLATT
jgi:methyltransferase (TIGR00027 family)